MSGGFESAAVLLLAGSSSDLDLVLETESTLEQLEIPSQIRVLSAHRTPAETVACVTDAEKDGFRVLIAFAGLSAHLAGVAAAHTLLPVIAVPVSAGALHGVDAMLASLQLPPGTPTAVVAIDGARNAALLAARILGISRPELRNRMAQLAERDRERYAPERIEAEIRKRRQAKK